MTRFDRTRSKDGRDRLEFTIRVRATLDDISTWLVAHHHGMPDLNELTTRMDVILEARRVLELQGSDNPPYIIGYDNLEKVRDDFTAHLLRVWAGYGKDDLAERLLAKHRKDTI